MEADQPTKWPSTRIFTMITVVTPWMRSPLFQSTMADPVIVMLVTVCTNFMYKHGHIMINTLASY